MTDAIYLCRSADLVDGGLGVGFEVQAGSTTQAAFAVRYAGQVHAYLNRCSHVPMTLDFMPGHFFDTTGQWLICASHGALFAPETGRCRGGPCSGGLRKIVVSEQDDKVYWHTSAHIQPLPPNP